MMAVLPIFSISLGQSLNEPFKKANTILIMTELSQEDAYKKWGRHLAQSGYSIEKSDDNFFSITTGPKDTSKFNYDFILLSSVNDSGIIILKIKWRLKSNLFSGTSITDFNDWEYRTAKTNVLNIIHEDFLPTINSFNPTNILYEVR